MNPLFILPLLGYNFGDVAPVMSAATIETHYTKHAQAYFDNLNRLVPGTEWDNASGKRSLEDIAREATTGPIAQNAGQAWNHVMFFEQFRPASQPNQPSDDLLALINQSFGSLEGLRAEFKQAATSLFGSGWVWLVMDAEGASEHANTTSGDRRLFIQKCYNDDNPLRHGLQPILVADVWEHAYYLDYRNRRGDYIDNLWQAINWQVIADRL